MTTIIAAWILTIAIVVLRVANVQALRDLLGSVLPARWQWLPPALLASLAALATALPQEVAGVEPAAEPPWMRLAAVVLSVAVLPLLAASAGRNAP